MAFGNSDNSLWMYSFSWEFCNAAMYLLREINKTLYYFCSQAEEFIEWLYKPQENF